MSRRKGTLSAGRKVAIGVVGGVVLGVVVLVLEMIYWTPERVLERRLEVMARDYYENYFYDRLMETTGEEGAEGLARYRETGLAPVPLRQLLLSQDGKWKEMKAGFNNEKYSCDETKTTVQFFPVAPYNRGDYTLKTTRYCNFM